MSQLDLPLGQPCYVCAQHVPREDSTLDYIGIAHNACINSLPPEQALNRARLQAKLGREAELRRQSA